MKRAIIAIILLISGLVVTPNIQEMSFADDTNTKAELVQDLTQEEAKALLEKMNPGVEYIYQGTEEDFQAITEKGYKGYVFLPNVETDLGMFVNKETKEVYYFHPSGYFELVK